MQVLCLKRLLPSERLKTWSTDQHESQAKAMEKSAKILIVLSHGFDGSQNLTTEIAQGLQRLKTQKMSFSS